MSVNDSNQFYLGLGKTYRAPIDAAVFYNTYRDSGDNPTESKPEESTTLDIGWPFYGPRASARASLYDADLKNKEVSGTNEDTGQTVYVAVPKGRMQGLNSKVGLKINDSWAIYASYSYTDAKMRSDLDSLAGGI